MWAGPGLGRRGCCGPGGAWWAVSSCGRGLSAVGGASVGAGPPWGRGRGVGEAWPWWAGPTGVGAGFVEVGVVWLTGLSRGRGLAKTGGTSAWATGLRRRLWSPGGRGLQNPTTPASLVHVAVPGVGSTYCSAQLGAGGPELRVGKPSPSPSSMHTEGSTPASCMGMGLRAPIISSLCPFLSSVHKRAHG